MNVRMNMKDIKNIIYIVRLKTGCPGPNYTSILSVISEELSRKLDSKQLGF